jgi:hypothetical protein
MEFKIFSICVVIALSLSACGGSTESSSSSASSSSSVAGVSAPSRIEIIPYD